jgi:signal transduction histidine kinase
VTGDSSWLLRVLENRAENAGLHAPEGSRRLGLTFCQVAVEAHGGHIWIKAANLGAAICFTVRANG